MNHPHEPDPAPPLAHRLAVRALATEADTPVSLILDAAEHARLARHLGVERVSDVALTGTLAPQGKRGWRLEARLRARVGQLCVVTLDPVVTEIDSPVVRNFQPGAEPAAVIALELGEGGEDAGDEPPEPLGDQIDLGAIVIEELALAIDPYPRAPGAELGSLSRRPPGAAPLDPEVEKPFAALAGLRARLAGDGD